MTLDELAAIQLLCNRIKEKFDVSKVLIFGSKARGDDEKYSDIDLLVLTNKEKTNEDRWVLSDFASDININYGVALNCLYFNENDWVNGVNVNPMFKANVEKDGIEIVL